MLNRGGVRKALCFALSIPSTGTLRRCVPSFGRHGLRRRDARSRGVPPDGHNKRTERTMEDVRSPHGRETGASQGLRNPWVGDHAALGGHFGCDRLGMSSSEFRQARLRCVLQVVDSPPDWDDTALAVHVPRRSAQGVVPCEAPRSNTPCQGERTGRPGHLVRRTCGSSHSYETSIRISRSGSVSGESAPCDLLEGKRRSSRRPLFLGTTLGSPPSNARGGGANPPRRHGRPFSAKRARSLLRRRPCFPSRLPSDQPNEGAT